MFLFFNTIFLIKSKGITVNAKNNIISNSYIVKPVVLKISPPKYISIIWTIAMNNIINMNTLFFNKLANVLILYVLALTALKIAKNINNPKNAVIKYLSLGSYLYIDLIILDFKKNIEIAQE